MITVRKDILNELTVSNFPNIALPEFLEKESSEYGYFVSENFILPFFVKKTFIFKSIRFVLGSVAISENCNQDQDKRFLDEVVKYIRQNKMADFIACPNPSALFSAVPDGSCYCSFGSYIVDLQSSEDDVWSKIHSKHKNVIRKAEKEAICISNSSEYTDDCIELIKDTLSRQHMGVPPDSYFSFLKAQAGVDFFVALQDDKVQGAAILAWTKERSSYYLYGGSALNVHNGAVSLLHWEAMKVMKQRGVHYYDFVGARVNPKPGSKLEGIQRFKSRFGGDMRMGYLWKIEINSFKSAMYYSMLSVYGKLKGTKVKDIIDQENE